MASYCKINTRKQDGFTIVELLIVIVIIGILAALVIVAYSGIQARANTTRQHANAVVVKKKAEAYAADSNGVYPATSTDFAANPLSKLPSGVGVSITAGLTKAQADANPSLVLYQPCNPPTGGRVVYFDYATNTYHLPYDTVTFGSTPCTYVNISS